MYRILSFALLACSIAAPAAAETVYVTDILRLGIHHAADTSDRAFDNLVSGDALTVLERSVNYARVRTADGREGWVKSAYLVSDKPAQLRVAEVEAEIEALQQKVAAAETLRAEAEREAARFREKLEGGTDSIGALEASVARLTAQNEEYEARFDLYRHSLPWSWVVAALVLTSIGGFVGGWWTLDALIRRRHGGFRIY